MRKSNLMAIRNSMALIFAIGLIVLPVLNLKAITTSVTIAQGANALQSAIVAANEGDVILVGPGTYSPIRTNGKKITIKSTEGAAVTVIDGGGTKRCAALASDTYDYDADGMTIDGSTLIGFTLKRGYDYGFDDDERDSDGGGIFGGIAVNCIIKDSRCYLIYEGEDDGCGGGASHAKLYNCLIVGNKSMTGAGASDSVLYNCTIVGNEAEYWSLAYSKAYNCIISGGRYLDSMTTKYYDCITPLGEPITTGLKNGDMRFVNPSIGDYRLQ